jgi:hypothetical protein
VLGQDNRQFVNAVQEKRQFMRTVCGQRNLANSSLSCEHTTVCGQESKAVCDRCVRREENRQFVNAVLGQENRQFVSAV